MQCVGGGVLAEAVHVESLPLSVGDVIDADFVFLDLECDDPLLDTGTWFVVCVCAVGSILLLGLAVAAWQGRARGAAAAAAKSSPPAGRCARGRRPPACREMGDARRPRQRRGDPGPGMGLRRCQLQRGTGNHASRPGRVVDVPAAESQSILPLRALLLAALCTLLALGSGASAARRRHGHLGERVGEARVPGHVYHEAEWGVATANVTALDAPGRPQAVASIPAQVIGLQETKLTAQMQRSMTKSLRNQGWHAVWGAPQAPRQAREGQAHDGGTWNAEYGGVGVMVRKGLPVAQPKIDSPLRRRLWDTGRW
eukprot:gene2286-21884_t